MQQETSTNERLASVEAKLQFIQDILKEIKSDLKDQVAKEDFENLRNKTEKLEKEFFALKTKVGIIAGSFGFLTALIYHVISKMMGL
jgi:DNA repair exonuclease SbcCD ATPase subunit